MRYIGHGKWLDMTEKGDDDLYGGPYSYPEKFDLRIVGEVERDHQPYQYHLFVVWQDLNSSQLYYAVEAGCSCPTPFEYTRREEMTPIYTYGQFDSTLRAFLDGDRESDPPSREGLEQADRLRREVKRLMDPFVDWAQEAAG